MKEIRKVISLIIIVCMNLSCSTIFFDIPQTLLGVSIRKLKKKAKQSDFDKSFQCSEEEVYKGIISLGKNEKEKPIVGEKIYDIFQKSFKR